MIKKKKYEYQNTGVELMPRGTRRLFKASLEKRAAFGGKRNVAFAA
jgi:hypothetical protein